MDRNAQRINLLILAVLIAAGLASLWTSGKTNSLAGQATVWFFLVARQKASFPSLAIGAGLFLLIFTLSGGFSLFWDLLFWILFLVPTLVFGIDSLRQNLLSQPLLNRIRKILPPMSETERDAIEAGSVWWESELFGGAPDWQKLKNYAVPELNADEQAFLDGPVDQLCAMIDDWDITHNRMDLPPEVWAFMREHRFFGMIIPKRYGGLEFSAHA